MPPPPGPRSLTQMLREADDPTLVSLLLARPDLAFPTPEDFSQVASRATTRHSVSAAVDLLDAFELWVARRLGGATGPVSTDELVPEHVDRIVVRAALDRLRRLALAWGGDEALRPVRVLGTVLGDDEPGPSPPSAPPELEVVQELTPALVDKVAAGSAFEFVRRMDVLVEHCDHQPLRRRRDGGLTTRQLRELTELLDLPGPVTTSYVELAVAAGLIGLTGRGEDEVLIPTHAYDEWQSVDLGQQWGALVGTWIDDARVGAPGWLTRLCLEGMGTPGSGAVVDAASLHRWIAWRRPRRPANAERLVGTVLEQASMLGVTALGAPASFGPTVEAATLHRLLPGRVEHVLLQADLTAIAPGPLSVEAARDLGALADVESRGGATVYRFSAQSLRRAYDLGWGADEIVGTLQERSTTPVPQPLSYLVHDVARQVGGGHGGDDGLHVHVPPERARPTTRSAKAKPADRLDREAAVRIVASLRREPVEAADDSTASADRRGSAEIRFDGPLAVLREAVETGEPVWFGFVDSTGATGERLVVARSVDDGMLEATDVRTKQQVRMPVPRITRAHIIRTSG